MNLCSSYNELIITNKQRQASTMASVSFSYYSNFLFNSSGSSKEIHLHTNVTKEGKYIVLVALCDATTSNVQISGQSVIKNPYGYFPARYYGLIPFSIILLTFYFILFAFWCYRCISHRFQIMPIHTFIGIMLLLCMISMLFRCVDNYLLNYLGSYFYPFRYLDIFVDVLTRTCIRAVSVLLSMG